ncbi:Immortalization Up-Regulated Protein [Manis pentadactyla]|nr:Immortalization Up-Regulated Protein [Manis pentadactyla]
MSWAVLGRGSDSGLRTLNKGRVGLPEFLGPVGPLILPVSSPHGPGPPDPLLTTMEFDLAAAIDSTSKKPQEAGQVRDPKHSPPKVLGQSESRAANKDLKDHGRSDSSSSSSSSDSDMEAKHGSTPGKVKTPRVKKGKKKEEKNKEKKKEGKKGEPH